MEHQEEFKEIFFTECSELLMDMEERLLKLESGVHDAQALNAIFRCAHSIKGGAGALGFMSIMQFTHLLEALLDTMRDGTLLPSREIIDTLLKSADVVTRMLEAVKNGREPDADSSAIGVILTGMGKDGSAGMLRMRECGAYNIGQSQSSCVIYGMPKAATAIGAVHVELPLSDIVSHILHYCGQERKRRYV